MSKINLFWYAKALLSETTEYGNFGDEVGPYLVEKLSGQSVNHVPIPRTSIKLILAYIKGLFNKVYSLKQLPEIVRCLFLNGNYIMSVGSIIGWGSGKRKVWGSGILFSNDVIDKDCEFHAVRGKYTQQRLVELGLTPPKAIGDPALLLPLVYDTNRAKSYELGLVPHHTQYKHFEKLEDLHGVKVINLLDNIENVIDNILSCELILSTSLHGIIVPHAYGIPALWYKFSGIDFYGEDIKYLDYFSSVDIPEHEPFQLKDVHDFNKDEELNTFRANSHISLPITDLGQLQKELLLAAPFEVSMNEMF